MTTIWHDTHCILYVILGNTNSSQISFSLFFCNLARRIFIVESRIRPAHWIFAHIQMNPKNQVSSCWLSIILWPLISVAIIFVSIMSELSKITRMQTLNVFLGFSTFVQISHSRAVLDKYSKEILLFYSYHSAVLNQHCASKAGIFCFITCLSIKLTTKRENQTIQKEGFEKEMPNRNVSSSLLFYVFFKMYGLFSNSVVCKFYFRLPALHFFNSSSSEYVAYLTIFPPLRISKF